MPEKPLTSQDRDTLIQTARHSISHGLAHGRPPEIDPSGYGDALREHRASFVTLKLEGRLRGCIGRNRAQAPLVVGVSRNAFAAAFNDPRFDRMTTLDWQRTTVEVSVLTPPVPMTFDSESELLSQLRPGVDGLVLEAGRCRSTFLPTVWETLPQPQMFLNQLKVKAGLKEDAWPKDIRVSRYTSESFGETD